MKEPRQLVRRSIILSATFLTFGIIACGKTGGHKFAYEFEVRRYKTEGLGMLLPGTWYFKIVNRSGQPCRNAVVVVDKYYKAPLRDTHGGPLLTSDKPNPNDIPVGGEIEIVDRKTLNSTLGASFFRDESGRESPTFGRIGEMKIICEDGSWEGSF